MRGILTYGPQGGGVGAADAGQQAESGAAPEARASVPHHGARRTRARGSNRIPRVQRPSAAAAAAVAAAAAAVRPPQPQSHPHQQGQQRKQQRQWRRKAAKITGGGSNSSSSSSSSSNSRRTSSGGVPSSSPGPAAALDQHNYRHLQALRAVSSAQKKQCGK